MKRIISAEIRQLGWVQVATLGAGAGMYGLIAFATGHFPTDAKSAGILLNYVLAMLICAAPVLVNWIGDWDRGRNSRYRLLETLPLPQWQLDLARLLAALLSLWPALLMWIPLWLLLSSIYGDVSGWLAVWVCLLIVLLMLLAMRWAWTLMAAYALLSLGMVPLYFLTDLEPLVRVPLSLVTTPWPSMALLLVTLAICWRMLQRRAPGGMR